MLAGGYLRQMIQLVQRGPRYRSARVTHAVELPEKIGSQVLIGFQRLAQQRVPGWHVEHCRRRYLFQIGDRLVKQLWDRTPLIYIERAAMLQNAMQDDIASHCVM